MNPATQPPTSEQTTAGVGLKIKRFFTSPDTPWWKADHDDYYDELVKKEPTLPKMM